MINLNAVILVNITNIIKKILLKVNPNKILTLLDKERSNIYNYGMDIP